MADNHKYLITLHSPTLNTCKCLFLQLEIVEGRLTCHLGRRDETLWCEKHLWRGWCYQ